MATNVICDFVIDFEVVCTRACVPIMMDPLLAGERNPTVANTIKKNAQKMSCMPVPIMT